MRTFALAFAALFAFAAAVQLNDPDPLGWIAIYLAAAGISAASVWFSVPAAVFLGLAAIAGLWALRLLATVLAEAAGTGTEIEREFGGLALITLVMIVLARDVWRATSGSA